MAKTTDDMKTLLELQNKEPTADGCYTIKELMRKTGWTHCHVSSRIDEAIDRGVWECLRVPRLARDGTIRPVAAYRPIPKKK